MFEKTGQEPLAGGLTGDPDEEYEMPKRDVFSIDEFSIDDHGDPHARSKGQYQPCGGDEQRGLPIPPDDPDVDFHPYEEEEEDEPDRSDQVEKGERGGREDVGGESWDPAESRRTEDDPSDDFGDDPGLTDVLEDGRQTLGETDDDDQLYDEEGDGLRGVEFDRVSPAKDARLTGIVDGRGVDLCSGAEHGDEFRVELRWDVDVELRPGSLSERGEVVV